MANPFRNRHLGPRLSADEAQRQGLVTRWAMETLGQPGVAVAFLNTHHETLGGRPIDIAIASAEGLLAVKAVLSGSQPA